jgi:oxaloacetate decarboxylase (Na+ extruding) subunit gamma
MSVGTGQLLSNALVLMVLGMGTVYVFLIILVYVTAAMSALVRSALQNAAPTNGNTAEPPAGRITAGTALQPEDHILRAVIAAAVQAHRNRS